MPNLHFLPAILPLLKKTIEFAFISRVAITFLTYWNA